MKVLATLPSIAVLMAFANAGVAEAGAPAMGQAGVARPAGSVQAAHATARHRHYSHGYAYRRPPAPVYYRPYYGAYYAAPRYYYPAGYPVYGYEWSPFTGWNW